MTAIRAEREHLDKQERLKQRMLDGIFADHAKYYELHILLERLFEKSTRSLDHVADVLKTDEQANQDAEYWKNQIPALRNPRNVGHYGKDLLYIQQLEELEKVKLANIEKLKGGIPKEEVADAMNLLYQIMVKHDAVSDKIVELVPDPELKAKLDGFEDQFEAIHKQYHDDADPKKLHENLNLLLHYQPIHLHLMGRLRGIIRRR